MTCTVFDDLDLARARHGELLGLPHGHVALTFLQRLECALQDAGEEIDALENERNAIADDLHRANGRIAVLEDELRLARGE